jgi:hypothetical protein
VGVIVAQLWEPIVLNAIVIPAVPIVITIVIIVAVVIVIPWIFPCRVSHPDSSSISG